MAISKASEALSGVPGIKVQVLFGKKKHTHTNCNISSEFDNSWLLCSFSFSHLQLTLKQLDCRLGIAKGSVGWSNTPLRVHVIHGTLESALWKKKGDLFQVVVVEG